MVNLDELMARIDEKYPNTGGPAINKLLVAKKMIIAIDPDLLEDEFPDAKPLEPDIVPPDTEPEPPLHPKPAAKKKKSRGRS